MRFQHQLTGKDCWSACLASLLDVTVSSVPVFQQGPGNLIAFNPKIDNPRLQQKYQIEVYLEQFGLRLEEYWLSTKIDLKNGIVINPNYKNIIKDRFYVGVLFGSDGKKLVSGHAVICKNKEIVFDPFPYTSHQHEEKEYSSNFNRIAGAYYLVGKDRRKIKNERSTFKAKPIRYSSGLSGLASQIAGASSKSNVRNGHAKGNSLTRNYR